MVGALSLGEALKRAGAALVLLLIVPCFIGGLIHGFVEPMLTNVATVLERAAYLLSMFAAIVLIGWLVIRGVVRFCEAGHKKREE